MALAMAARTEGSSSKASVSASAWRRVAVMRLAAAIDVGRAINPTNCLQQIEGGVVHGIGTTLFEDMVMDEEGHLINPNLHDYKMPTAMDVPEVLPSLVEAYHNEGPYGAKGMGEVVTNSAMAAIGMLSGYCGTLMTPMAANFNLVPVALLELDDPYAVIRAQIPTALALLAANVALMYLLVFR